MDPRFEMQNPQKQGSLPSTGEEAWLERPMTKLLSFAWVCILWIHFIKRWSFYRLSGASMISNCWSFNVKETNYS